MKYFTNDVASTVYFSDDSYPLSILMMFPYKYYKYNTIDIDWLS